MPEFTVPRLIAGLALCAAVAIALLPAPVGVDPAVMGVAALAVFALGFWATGVIPEHLTAIAFFLVAMLFAVAPPEVVFSGFHSTAVWLVFGGLVIGVAIKRSGLGERLARALAGRMGGSYPAVISGVVVAGTVLAFFMPSSLGRTMILLPIVLALADRLGFGPKSRGRAGMALAACLGTVMSGAGILPANVPNMVMIGAGEALYGFVPAYGSYLLLHFPVTAALKAVALVVCICVMFPDRPAEVRREAEAAPDASPEARRLMIVLALALALWATDFLHHISPAWIALGAALFCLLPRVGMVPASAFNGEIAFSSLFFVAGILGLGLTIAHSGLGDLLTGRLVEAIGFAPDQPARSFAALSLLTMLVGMVTTMPGLPAVMAPLAGGVAEATGLPLETVLMTQVIGFSTIVLPYQAPPVFIGLQLAGLRIRDGAKLLIALTAITILILLPLNYLWWSYLGYFG